MTISIPSSFSSESAETSSFDGSLDTVKLPQSPPSRAELAPLLALYQRRNHPNPAIQFINPNEIPSPYRALLDHSSNMTPTLEKFCQSKLSLKVFEILHEEENQIIDRWIALKQNNQTTMEFGSIRIHLNSLPRSIHSEVIRGVEPFASILINAGVRQICQPSGFFIIQSDEIVREFLNSDELSASFYGRCNTIESPDGERIASVVEILPTLNKHQSL